MGLTLSHPAAQHNRAVANATTTSNTVVSPRPGYAEVEATPAGSQWPSGTEIAYPAPEPGGRGIV
ncbi:Uncharacterised protein [Mycobacteroides abscessus subsp. abscessus]|nr:Uncharacterised protein [Mycobacteroides abscessus subsp. abscessus]